MPAGDDTAVGVAELTGQVAGEQGDGISEVDDPVVPDPGVGVLAALGDVVGPAGTG